MANYLPVRGTQDYLPAETRVREYVRKTILQSYANFGFLQIKTPILESIELLNGSDGGDNLRLMFKVLKRGEKLGLANVTTENDLVDMGLRYDLTVPLARFYAGNHEKLPLPFKSIQIDEAFRAERPQKGRLRQFAQCDIDILGDATVNAEIECLMVSAHAMQNLGFKQFEYRISDRRILTDIITSSGYNLTEVSTVCVTLDKLDKIGLDGVIAELAEKQLSGDVNKLKTALTLVQEQGLQALNKLGVNSDAVTSLNTIISSVNALAVNMPFKAVFDISIIRGQGYYTSTVFELYAKGFNGACGGGGRYDTMLQKISGKHAPAVGFSFGFERLCLILNEQGFVPPQSELLALVYQTEAFTTVFAKAQELSNSYAVSCTLKAKNFSNQLLKLKESGFTKWMQFGDNTIQQIK